MSSAVGLLGNSSLLRLEPSPWCPVCGAAGKRLYEDLTDRFDVAEGSWSYACCPACDTAWLDPRISAEDLHRLYTSYYTHSAFEEDWAHRYARSGTVKGLSPWGKLALSLLLTYCGRWEDELGNWRRLLARMLLELPPLRDIIGGRVAWQRRRPGVVLDLGCGNGLFLGLMRRLGWSVLGAESDLKAVRGARRQFELDVREGPIETLEMPSASCDLVTANHVVEHLQDPYVCIRRAISWLRPGGEMILTTPNYRGLGHRIFHEAFRDLDPPRHLHLLSGTSLTKALTGLHPEYAIDIRSSSRHARWVWIDSWSIRRRNRFAGRASYASHALGILFQAIEESIRLVSRKAGDELVVRIVRIGQ